MSKASLIEEGDGWFRNEAKTFTYEIVDDNEQPLDVSSMSLAWVVEELHDGGTDILSVTTPTITIGNGVGTGSKVSVPVTALATSLLEPRVYNLSLLRTDGGQLQMLTHGSAMLQQGAEWDDGS